MKSEKILKRLNEFLEVRNHLVECSSISNVSQEAVTIIQKKIKSQTTSVFMFSKDGLLHRIAIGGFDYEGNAITNDWFPDEKYGCGESFTGKATIPIAGSKYGKPHWSNNLSLETIDEESKNKYFKKLGSLKSAIAVPLNGQHNTFGVLEVINKASGSARSNGFTGSDINWLSLTGIILATAISHFRRKNELNIIAEISKMLVEPFSSERNQSSVYQRIINQLVGSDTCYKICILRIAKPDGKLEIIAKATDGVTWDGYIDESVTESDRISWKVYSRKIPIVIEDVIPRIHEFKNHAWIQYNNLRSYACFPLLISDKVVGTLSVFTGFSHKYYENDLMFLGNIAFFLATLYESFITIDELIVTREKLFEQRERIQMSAIQSDIVIKNYLHNLKNSLSEITKELYKVKESISGRPSTILEKSLDALENRVVALKKMYSQISVQQEKLTNITQVIRNVIKETNFKIKGKNITVTENLDIVIPELKINQVELKQVIGTILDNAIKAIEYGKVREGCINITTEIREIKKIETIIISVDDNGIGIRNEYRHKIFNENFTTFPGGTGQGLPLIKQIICDSFGGEILFESIFGKGTKFIVRIPMKRFKP